MFQIHVEMGGLTGLFALSKLLVALILCLGGDVAQLTEHRTGTPPTRVRFPGAVRDFSSKSISVQTLLRRPYNPPRAIAGIYICAHVKDSVVHIRVRWIMETLKTTSTHLNRLGSTTLSQLAFPGGSNPNFSWKKFHWDNTVLKSKK